MQSKNAEFTGVIEQFFDKHNADIGLYGQTLISFAELVNSVPLGFSRESGFMACHWVNTIYCVIASIAFQFLNLEDVKFSY